MHLLSDQENLETLLFRIHYFADTKKFDPETSIVSGMIILTNFNIYQADAFKKFAISINAALSYITKKQMFLEVFHPEFVGHTGSSDHLRRSPYPMLQVCNRYGRRKPL